MRTSHRQQRTISALGLSFEPASSPKTGSIQRPTRASGNWEVLTSPSTRKDLGEGDDRLDPVSRRFHPLVVAAAIVLRKRLPSPLQRVDSQDVSPIVILISPKAKKNPLSGRLLVVCILFLGTWSLDFGIWSLLAACAGSLIPAASPWRQLVSPGDWSLPVGLSLFRAIKQEE